MSLQHEELVTIISRIASHGRIWFCYDSKQSDLGNNRKNDMEIFANIFDDDECNRNGFMKFKFSIDDIVRSEFCKFVMGRLEDWESMEDEEEYEKKFEWKKPSPYDQSNFLKGEESWCPCDSEELLLEKVE